MLDNHSQQEESLEVKEINIEICTNCSQHQTHTRHNEQTYIKLFAACKQSIESQLAGVQVVKNGNIKPGYLPSLGAFEISCNGILIYSKIKTGLWPQPSLVATRVKNFVDDYKAGKNVKHYVEIKEKKIVEEKRIISPSTVYGNFYSPQKQSDEKQLKQTKEEEQLQYSQFNMEQNQQIKSPKENIYQQHEEINSEHSQQKQEKKKIENQITKSLQQQEQKQEQQEQQEQSKQQEQSEQQEQQKKQEQLEHQQESLQEPKEEVQQSQPEVQTLEQKDASIIPEKKEEEKKQDIEEKPNVEEEQQ